MGQDIKLNKKKISPIGVKIISFLLILPFTYLFTFYVSSFHTLGLLNDRKAQILQSDKYKKLEINSVEKLDSFLREEVRKSTPRVIFFGAIIAVLVFGLWTLKKWARIAAILYSLFAIGWNIVCLFPGASVVKISKIPALLTSIAVLYYLNRHKVKDLFK